MARESLKACQAGISKAKIALTGKSWTQEELAAKVETTRQPVAHFFAGKGVDRKNFVKICEMLGLDWQEIAGKANSTDSVGASEEANASTDIDTLVQEVREKVRPYIQERCGTMRVLDMTQPIGLNDIYTNVNILEKIVGRRGLSLAELQQNLNNLELSEFDRFGLCRVTEECIPGIKAVERHSKLMVLGKPGAGKTTFLKHLAIQCIFGEFQSHQIPVFIPLKEFTEINSKPGLKEFILQKIEHETITNTQLEKILYDGRFIILLDGLDEVRKEDNDGIINQVKVFSEKYYKNKFIITCRIAAREYIFEKFTEVEIADFDYQQIADFANKWFQNKNSVKAQQFIQKLDTNQRIKELATNPLLLTLLCLVFDDSTDFPSNRAELYEQGIDILLRKWDGSRNIEREQAYRRLSIKRKEDLLSQIALTSFEDGNYFFKQREIEQYISNYIQNLPDVQNDAEVLLLDSRAILKSIEAQHGLLVQRARGIYSFSHLTFQEYFTARAIVYSSNSEKALQSLASHMMEIRWREVLLLALGMLLSADRLFQLMKQQVDELVAADEKLQDFLVWVNEKSLSVDVSYKQKAIRTFYFGLVSGIDRIRNCRFNKGIVRELNNDIFRGVIHSSVLDLDRALVGALEGTLAPPLERDHLRSNSNHDNYFLDFVRGDIGALESEPELEQVLQQLKAQLPNPEDDREIFKQWCEAKSLIWAEQLRTVMIQHRNIGHDWQFSDEQKNLLNQYFDANKLLVDCLKSDCYVSREVRQEIEDTLLLPVNRTQQTS